MSRKKRFLSMILLCSVTACTLPHTAISEKSDVTQTEKRQILEGFPDGELHLDDTLTRAQFAKILITTFTPSTTELRYTFSDLSDSHWAYTYIQQAANAKWINGFTDDTFRPDEEITYEQAISIVCRILDLGSNEKYPFNYISAAMEYSLTENIPCLIGDIITRGEAETLILNALEFKEEYESSSWYPNYYTSPNKTSSSGGGSGGGNQSHKILYNESPEFLQEDSMSENVAAPSYDYTEEFVDEFDAEEYVNGFNTEEYVSNDENIFKSAITSPLSTFSIDTDTASYSNLRRFILNGQKIPNGSIRTEELINYFDYKLSEPDEPHPLGVNYTYSSCPWNPENLLLKLTVSGEELKEKMPSNIVFLIDTSGSMDDYNKLPLVKKSLSMLLDNLGENDRISIVTYASGTRVALEPTPATKKEKILDTIDNLTAYGATAGSDGITLAYEQAEKFKTNGNNRIILCTDGDFNIGTSSTGDLKKLITEKREKGIFLSVLGFGMYNYKDSKMETLADCGNGNYAYIDNLREAKKVLVDDMSKTIYTIAKDVKIQAEFNPEKVSEYRLIGYENRILNAEDFSDDKKDAGELGSDACVTVLYEIKPQSSTPNTEYKYQTVTTTGSNELMNVKIRYKKPDGDESILVEYPVSSELNEIPDEDFYFAAAVAELGMILNDSEYKGSSTYDTVIETAKLGIGEDKFGLRNEFIQLVDLLRISQP